MLERFLVTQNVVLFSAACDMYNAIH